MSSYFAVAKPTSPDWSFNPAPREIPRKTIRVPPPRGGFSDMKTADEKSTVFNQARVTGLEPAASPVHVFPYFHRGVDYIFTVSIKLVGALVSSLYGAPPYGGSLGVRMSTYIGGCSLHRYPKEFQFAFQQKAAFLQGSALTS
jgi:hypothetical protein